MQENTETRIEELQAEQSTIEDRKTHQGFGDASRRNRIKEQLGEVHEAQRRKQSSLPGVKQPEDDKR